MTIANPYLHGMTAEDTALNKLRRWAAVASLSVATILVSVKFFAFIVTDSVSLLSSLMDSTFDAFASLVTVISITHAARAADEKHRFGHGKIEALSAMMQAIFIFGSAGFLFYESAVRFLHPQRVHDVSTGLGVMILSVILTGALIVFQNYVIRRTKSVAISADHMHYKGDLMMNLGVFAALALSYYSKWPYYDAIFAMIISLALLWGAKGITRESFDILLDKELPEEDRKRIEAIVRQHKDVWAIHDLRTRSTGERIFIEFHLEIDGSMTLTRAHAITEDVEKALFEAFPKSEVIIHQEPAGIDDHRIDNIVAQSA